MIASAVGFLSWGSYLHQRKQKTIVIVFDLQDSITEKELMKEIWLQRKKFYLHEIWLQRKISMRDLIVEKHSLWDLVCRGKKNLLEIQFAHERKSPLHHDNSMGILTAAENKQTNQTLPDSQECVRMRRIEMSEWRNKRIYERNTKRNVWGRTFKRISEKQKEMPEEPLIKNEFSDKQKSVWESKNNVWKTENNVWWTGRKKEERKNSFHRNRMYENQSDGFWKIAILIVMWDCVYPSKKRNRKKISGMGCLPWTLSATVLLMRVAGADDSQLGWSTRHSLMGEERWIDRRARSGDFLSLFPLFIFWGFFCCWSQKQHILLLHISLSLSHALLLGCWCFRVCPLPPPLHHNNYYTT
jgi:hypothetical protein